MNKFNYRKGLFATLMAIGGLSSANALISPTASDSPLLQNVSQQITTDTNTVDLSSAFDVNAGTKLIDVTPLTSHSACDVISIKKAKGEFTLASNVAANCQYEFTIKDIEKNKATAYAQVVINADDASAHQLPMTSAQATVGECLDFDLSQSLDTTRYQLKDIANATLGTTSVTNNTFTYCAQSAGAAVVNYTVTDTDDGHLLAGTVAVANSATRNPSIAAQDYAGPTVLPNASISIDVCPSESNSALSNTCHLTNADLLDVRVANASVTNINGTQFTFSASQEGWYDVAYTANSNSDYASGVVRIKVENIVADAIAQPVMVDEHSVYTAPWRVEQAQQQGVVFAESKTENTNNGVFDMALFNFAQAQSVCANQGMSLPTKVQFNALTDAYPNIQASAGWPVLKPYWMQSGKVKAFDLTKQKPQIVSAEDSYNVTCFYAGSLSALQAAQNDSAISAQSNDTDAVTSSQDVSVTLTNSNGNALSDQVVYFYSDSSDVAFENATTSTDANGQASTSVTATASHAVYANYLSQTQQLVVPFSESVEIADFNLSPNPLTIYQGDTVDALTATITFSDDTSMELAGNEVFWQPGNDKISIDKVGKITGEKPGFSSIKGEYKLNNQVVNASVTVIVLERITVDSMSVTPATTTLDIGGTDELEAVVTLSDATTYNSNDNPELFTWTSHKPSVVSVGTNTGELTARAEGDDVKVEATFKSNELTQSAHATVTVLNPEPVLQSVKINPDVLEIQLPDTDKHKLTATATFTNGDTITTGKQFDWVSNNKAVVKVNANGKVTAQGEGETTVSATYTDAYGTKMTGTATIKVLAIPEPVLTKINVTPAKETIEVGSTQSYIATGVYDDDSEADLTKLVTWDSSKPEYATITAAGIAKGVAEGDTSIVAQYVVSDGDVPKLGMAKLTVEKGEPLITSMKVTPFPLGVAYGTPGQLTAIATVKGGNEIKSSGNPSFFTWVSADKSIAKVDSNGVVTAVAKSGSTKVSATFSFGGETLSAYSLVYVYSEVAKPTSVIVTPSQVTLIEGAKKELTAVAYLDNNTTVTDESKFTWKTSKSSVASVSASGVVTAEAKGTAIITGSYTVDGVTKSDTSVVTVTSGVVLSEVTLSPEALTFQLPDTEQQNIDATAKFSDGTTVTGDSKFTWSSSNTSVASVNAYGRVTPKAVGSATISATYTDNGVSQVGKATVTVRAEEVVLSSLKVTLRSGFSATSGEADSSDRAYYDAIAYYSDGTSKSVRQNSNTEWGSSDTAIATVANNHNTYSGNITPKSKVGTTYISAVYTEGGINQAGSKLFTTTVAPVEVLLDSVDITPSALTFDSPSAAEQNLDATANFSDGTTVTGDTKFTWSSSNTSVASVTSYGRVTPKAAGSATISAKYTDNGVSKVGTATVTVKAEEVVLSSVEVTLRSGFSATSGEADSSDRAYYDAIAYYSDGTSKNIRQNANTTWSSKDTSIATVANNHNVYSGNITPKSKVGTTQIRAAYTEGGVTLVGNKEFTTTAASVSLSSVNITPETASIDVGKTKSLVAVVKLSDGSEITDESKLTWKSGDTSKVTVDSKGVVTGKTAGTAIITGSYTLDGVTKSSTSTITVEEENIGELVTDGGTRVKQFWGSFVYPNVTTLTGNCPGVTVFSGTDLMFSGKFNTESRYYLTINGQDKGSTYPVRNDGTAKAEKYLSSDHARDTYFGESTRNKAMALPSGKSMLGFSLDDEHRSGDSNGLCVLSKGGRDTSNTLYVEGYRNSVSVVVKAANGTVVYDKDILATP